MITLRTNFIHPKESIRPGAIFQLPKEIQEVIFKMLPLEDLGRCARVCKTWNEHIHEHLIMDELKKKYKNFFVFDKEIWKTYSNFINTNLPSISYSFPHSFLSKLEELFPRVMCDSGVSILIMPQGLTIKKVIEIAKNLDMRIELPEFFYQFKDKPIEKTYRIAISNFLIQDTLDHSNFLIQRTLDHSYEKKEQILSSYGYRMPSLLETVTHVVLCQKHLGKTLYPYPIFCQTSEAFSDYRLHVSGPQNKEYIRIYCKFPHNETIGAAAVMDLDKA